MPTPKKKHAPVGAPASASAPIPRRPLKQRIAEWADGHLKEPAKAWRKEEAMERYGIRNIALAAKLYNRWRYSERRHLHDKAFRQDLDKLLTGHSGGKPVYPPRIVMKDGYAIDESQTLPGLDRLLADAGEVVRERGGRTHGDVQRPYFRNLMFYDDIHKYPSWLDFVVSPEILATTIEYLKTIPVLSKTRPPGVRFMESNQNMDPNPPGPWEASQLFHRDLHDRPLVYVIVLIEDVTMDCGPWVFLPASVSERASKAMGYQKRGRPYRVTDEEMYRHVDPGEAITFAYPKGTVLFIDSSKCFHYGSRLSYTPRMQMMYAYTSVCRTDFSQTFMSSFPYPVNETDSRLRKMVLE